MVDLKIPNLNKKSNKFFLKKKLTLRTKSKRKLINESIIMLSLSILIIYLNYIIPNQITILSSLSNNFNKLFANFLLSLSYFYEICIGMFIIISLIFALILMLGSFSRFIKIMKRKKR